MPEINSEYYLSAMYENALSALDFLGQNQITALRLLADELSNPSGAQVISLRDAIGGVGKTTLLNAIEPLLTNLGIAVVSDYDDPRSLISSNAYNTVICTDHVFTPKDVDLAIPVTGFTHDELRLLLHTHYDIQESVSDRIVAFSLGSFGLAQYILSFMNASTQLDPITSSAHYCYSMLPDHIRKSYSSVRASMNIIQEYVPDYDLSEFPLLAIKIYELNDRNNLLNGLFDFLNNNGYHFTNTPEILASYQSIILKEMEEPTAGQIKSREPRIAIATSIPIDHFYNFAQQLVFRIRNVIRAPRKTELGIFSHTQDDHDLLMSGDPYREYLLRGRKNQFLLFNDQSLANRLPEYRIAERCLPYKHDSYRVLALTGQHNTLLEANLRFAAILESLLQELSFDYAISYAHEVRKPTWLKFYSTNEQKYQNLS